MILNRYGYRNYKASDNRPHTDNNKNKVTFAAGEDQGCINIFDNKYTKCCFRRAYVLFFHAKLQFAWSNIIFMKNSKDFCCKLTSKQKVLRRFIVLLQLEPLRCKKNILQGNT